MDNAKPIYKFKKAIVMFLAAAMVMTSLSACKGNEIPDLPDATDPPATTTEPTATTPEATTEPTTTESPVTEPEPVEPLEKYLEYYEQNNDFVGWITIPGLVNSKGKPYVDYAVVQTTDNEFYLDKDFDKKKDKAGWIYADYKVPITENSQADNITLYGHSMKDGSFFRHLLDYKSSSKGLDLINDAYIIDFDTRWEESQYVIVSCFLIGTKKSQDDLPLFQYFTYRNFKSEENYNEFYDNIMLRSYYNSDVECEYDDEFLTLSTCAYDFSDSRWVVVARKAREGEDISKYEGTYVKNRDKHMPSILDD